MATAISVHIHVAVMMMAADDFAVLGILSSRGSSSESVGEKIQKIMLKKQQACSHTCSKIKWFKK